MKEQIWKPLLFIIAILLASPAFANSYSLQLDRILKEYEALPKSEDVSRLVGLDRELTTLCEEIQKNDVAGKSASIWKQQYEAIGIYVGHYSNQIGYSGKLLVEAHKLNPNSPYREYTLFTTILGEGSSSGLGEMPNIEQANEYVAEFPNGPYAAKTYSIIGSFYDDLAKVISALIENEAENKDYKYDCFSSFLTEDSYPVQLKKAKTLALKNLGKAISLTPENESIESLQQEMAEIMGGESFSWYWCAD